MKKYFLLKITLLLVLAFSGWATSMAQSFSFSIRNDVQTSDRTLEFDLFLLNTNPSVPIQIGAVQVGIALNPNIINGGTLSSSFVSDNSNMAASQQPMATTIKDGCIKIAARRFPNCGTGSIMSSNSPGSRFCRIKITNSVPFASFQPNMAFNFTKRPYATMLAYFKSNCPKFDNLNVNSTNCYSLASNLVLNSLPVVTTDSLRKLGSSSGILAGSVTYMGSPFASNHGFVYSSTDSMPTIDDNIIGLGGVSAPNAFVDTLTNLSSSTYYVRAFASSSLGTVYGNVLSFNANRSLKLADDEYEPRVYQNGGSLTVDLAGCKNVPYSLRVFDQAGRTLWVKSLLGGATNSFLLPGKGAYIVHLNVENFQKVYKIVF